MIIDLNTDNLMFAETNYEMSRLKSNTLVKEVINQHNQSGQNFMIVPMSIYNILEANSFFMFAKLDSLMSEYPLRHMGSIKGIEIYLDLFSPSDTIILKYDKSIMRDNKIDSLLNGHELKEEIEITVLNY